MGDRGPYKLPLDKEQGPLSVLELRSILRTRPTGGEIDIKWNMFWTPTILFMAQTMHWNNNSVRYLSGHTTYHYTRGDYHIYAVEWVPFKSDGTASTYISKITMVRIMWMATEAFHWPFFITPSTLAMGGDFPAPDGQTNLFPEVVCDTYGYISRRISF